MPAGLPYFAWIDASETTFDTGHMRWDESIFSFELKQEEGDPASLTVKVRRPTCTTTGDAIGLLGPGRKIWCWFALDCGPALVKFRGRLVGIPTSIFEDLVTLEFVARPSDVVAQKEALAETLRVLPFYDPVMIDKERRSDPDVVLEGYTKVWHYDRETHVLTVSDEITGEDGSVDFDGGSDDGKVFWDGLGLTLTSGPLTRVDINAEFTWTQQARGTVDLTPYLMSHWPGMQGGAIYSMTAGDWPKHGASLGDGWEVAESSAQDVLDFSTHTDSRSGSFTLEEDNGGTSKVTWSSSNTQCHAPISMGPSIVTDDSYSVTHDLDEDEGLSASGSRSYATSSSGIGVQMIKATLVAGYSAERQCTERVSLTLVADVQPILTDPEDGEALRLDDIHSVNLSEAIGDELPIGDPRRRSYIATERGNRSLEYLIAFARSHLMKRSRVVEITFAPKLSRMPEVTLRKSAFLAEPRVGEARGKIIGYSIALDGSDGRPDCRIRMGCTIGRGGLAVAVEGTPVYASTDYVGFDYQRFIGRTVLVDVFEDSSVGYQPPDASPNDDGIDFLSALSAEDVIEVGLTVEYGSEHGENGELITNSSNSANTTDNEAADLFAAANAFLSSEVIPSFETRAKFKLKSMKRDFSSDYELQVTDLKVPTGYDLEAVCDEL